MPLAWRRWPRRMVNAIGPPSAVGSASSAASTLDASVMVSRPMMGFTSCISLGVAAARDRAGPGSPDCRVRSTWRIGPSALRVRSGTRSYETGASAWPDEVGDRAAELELVGRAGDEVVLGIDRDVDALDEHGRRPRARRR